MASPYETTQTPAEEPVEVNATRARGGSWGRHILWVLLVSMVLAAIALFGSYALNSPKGDEGSGGQERRENAASFDTAPRPAVQNTENSPSGAR